MKFFQNRNQTGREPATMPAAHSQADRDLSSIVAKLREDDARESADSRDDVVEDRVEMAEAHDEDAAEVSEARPEPPQRELLNRTPRLSEFLAFNRINEDLDQHLQTFSERIALARQLQASMKPYLEQSEKDIRRADEIEEERNRLAESLTTTRKNLDRTLKDLSRAENDLLFANSRISELRTEAEQRRLAGKEVEARSERLRAELAKANSDISYLHDDIARLTASNEHHAVAKANAEQARADLEARLSKLQHDEASARNRVLELSAQNDRLTNQLPVLIAEHENVQSMVRSLDRERADLEARLASAHDRIGVLETEAQELESRLASEAFTLRTELDMSHSAYRTLERAQSESEARTAELQGQLREADAWRDAALKQLRWLEAELETARRESSGSLAKLSDLNLKYMTDLISLDHHREQNKELQRNLDALAAENRRLVKFESLYRAAEAQIAGFHAGREPASREASPDRPAPAHGAADLSPANDEVQNQQGLAGFS